MAQIIPPGRREQFFDSNGDPTLRFIRWIEDISSANNTNTNIIVDSSDDAVINRALTTRPAQLFNHQSQINEASDRIEANEIDLSTRPRMADLYKVNQKVDELIDELIEQLEKLNTGSEAQRDLISLQAKSLKQVILLNARIEEAFNTKIEEIDIE